jgi:hypothetical protein
MQSGATPVHLALLDVRMPKMSGPELLVEAARKTAHNQVPIRVVLSAPASPNIPLETSDLRAKPETIDDRRNLQPPGQLDRRARGATCSRCGGLTSQTLHAPHSRCPAVERNPHGRPRLKFTQGQTERSVPIAVGNSLHLLDTQPNFSGDLPKSDSDLLDGLDKGNALLKIVCMWFQN